MKLLITLALLLPIFANAQVDRSVVVESNTVQGIDKNGNRTVTQRQTYQQTEGVRNKYTSCDAYEWKTQLSKGNSFKCNWSYREALSTGLTEGLDGFKIDWYDTQTGQRGSIIIVHSMPYSDYGWCRLVTVGDLVPGGTKYSEPFYMCYDQSDKEWRKFKGR